MDDDVVAARRRPSGEEFVLGPRDRAVAVLVEVHEGPGRGEVVVALGVDRGQRRGIEAFGEVAGRDRGGIAGIVPALEGHDQDRVAEVSVGMQPVQVVGRDLGHVVTLSARPTGAIGQRLRVMR